MVNSIRAELYKLTHRAYFYGFNLCCAAFALLVVGCLCYIKFTAAPSAELVNFPFALTPLYLGMPIGLYLVMVGGDAVFSEQYKYNTLKNEVSYGLTRTRIYLSRLIVTLLLMAVIFVVTMGVYLLASLVLLGIPSDAVALDSFGMNAAQSVQMVMGMLGFYVLASLPLWLGSLAIAIACLFLIRGSNIAGMGFLVLMVGVPALLDKLGYYVHPFFRQLYHLTLNYSMDLVTSSTTLGWAVIGRCWIIGLSWAVIATAAGLFFFSRREIN